MDDIFKDMLKFDGSKNFKLKQEEIEKKVEHSKNLSELLVKEDFIVDSFVCRTKSTSVDTRDQVEYGKKISLKKGGHRIVYELEVSSFSPNNVSTKKIIFDGNLNIRAGDYISVLIPKYEEEKISLNSSKYNGKTILLDRDFRVEEKGIEVILLSQDGDQLEKYFSEDYNLHFR